MTTDLLAHISHVYVGLSTSELIERSLTRGEASLGRDGQLCVLTGVHTGRAANDKYIVERPETTADVAWGPAGAPMSVASFESLKEHVQLHLTGKDVYVIDFVAGGSRCRLVTEFAWQAVFVSNLFKRVNVDDTTRPDLTIFAIPTCEAIPSVHKTRSPTFIALDLKQGLCLIGGTSYAGEIKKTVFTYLSWVLPLSGIMPMHSSVTTNATNGGDQAVFFGLSGTGKTTLSAEWNRRLLGDDEHGWAPNGLFNFEAGCYAKAIKLSSGGEPYIWKACHKFATVLENVAMDPVTRELDFESARHAENTRAAYPLEYIPQSYPPGTVAGHPKSIIMLTCDAFGVLPAFARLSPDAAIYHFLSGYTAKVAGTEKGVTAPTATFSTCFGAPFMPHHANVYATLLRRYLDEHKPRIYLVNTGWAGGPAGIGSRMSLSYTRAIVRSILEGDYDQLPTTKLAAFNLDVPLIPEGAPTHHHLSPMLSWSDPSAYDEQAKKLVQLFNNNFTKFKNVSENVINAGPML